MPEIEYAAFGAHSLEAWRSLARHAGLGVEQVAKLAMEGELRSLFGPDGELLRRAEIRSRFGTGGLSPAKALADLRRKRPNRDGSQALDAMLAKRPVGSPRAELLRLQAKRQDWKV